MASVKLIEPKKKPRYYQITANVLVNGKIERRYGRFDFDPTQLKNARARNAAANAAAAEFERQEQEKADKEASNAGKSFAVVAQEYIESKRQDLPHPPVWRAITTVTATRRILQGEKKTICGKFSSSRNLHRNLLAQSKERLRLDFGADRTGRCAESNPCSCQSEGVGYEKGILPEVGSKVRLRRKDHRKSIPWGGR